LRVEKGFAIKAFSRSFWSAAVMSSCESWSAGYLLYI